MTKNEELAAEQVVTLAIKLANKMNDPFFDAEDWINIVLDKANVKASNAVFDHMCKMFNDRNPAT